MRGHSLILLLAASAVVLAPPAAMSQAAGGLAFLKIATSAEALGGGSALTAYSRDAFSTFANPAGLGGHRPNAAGVGYTAWVGDVQLFNLAARIQAGSSGAFGLAVTSSSTGGIQARDQPGASSGTFDAQFVSAGLGYGRSFGPVRAGVTAKYLSEQIFTETATGYAFDLGVQIDVLPEVVWLGAAVQHLGKMNELNLEKTDIPETYRAGITVEPLTVRTSDDDESAVQTFLSLDVVHRPVDDVTAAQIGVWVFAFDFLWLRAGYLGGDALRSYTAGLGLLYKSFRFDYAYLPFEAGFGNSGQALTIQYFW